jgi:septum formation protein
MIAGLQAAQPPLVLASGSVWRLRLLEAAGLRAERVAAAVDEAAIKAAARQAGLSAVATVQRLAAAKAAAVAASRPEALVIGADQMLVCGGAWLDKPADLATTRAQLTALRGRSHALVTGVVCWRDGGIVWQHVARPRLTMRQFSDAFLDAYLAVEAAHLTGCVGGYRIEGPGLHLFERVTGETAAIIGLPLLPLLGFLRDAGIVLA